MKQSGSRGKAASRRAAPARKAKPARPKPARPKPAKAKQAKRRIGPTAKARPAKQAAAPAQTARFRSGDRVRVSAMFPPGHLRTPHYIRGKSGVIERLCGAFANPEELAFGRPGTPRQPLYRVRFAQGAVWPDYAGAAGDTIDIEIYQHWLEPA